MKKIIFLFSTFLSISAFAQNSQNYEAENATNAENIQLKEDKTASGGKYLTFGEKSMLKWVVESSYEGWFKIAFRYKSKKGDVAHKIDINEKSFGVGFSYSQDWNDAFYTAFLKKGENTIVLRPSYGIIDLDYLQIPKKQQPILPSISPIQGVFYKNNPSEITIYADTKNNKLKFIYSGNYKIDFKLTGFKYVDGAYHISLAKDILEKLPLGKNIINLEFEDKSSVQYVLDVKEKPNHAGLTLVMLNVNHGNSVLALLSNGKKILIDSGKEEFAKSVVIPFLDTHNIDQIDYYILTHYHEDHIGAKDEIIKKYKVKNLLDYKSFKSGDTLKIDNSVITILNSFSDGIDENDKSMSFLLNWNGFTYSHGADNYSNTQDRILKFFNEKVNAQIFYANHHFHGSVNPNFIFKTNPYLIVVSAQEAVYARGAYMDIYKEQTEKMLFASHAKLKETLLTLEVGTVVVRVNSAEDWFYETYYNNNNIVLPN